MAEDAAATAAAAPGLGKIALASAASLALSPNVEDEEDDGG